MRKRTLARELALQLLFQMDVQGPDAADRIDPYLREQTKDAEIAAFAREIVFGYWERREFIDRKIEEVAANWELKRMAIVDRNVLRIATFELLFRDDIPPLVAINEAIDIAKKFSTKNSGQFVNGILDNIRLKNARGNVAQVDSGKT